MTVKFEMDGPLAIATFSDPPMNLLTAESLTGLEAAMEKALEAKARAFLTLAEGDHFCRGANVPENFLGKNANDGRRLLNQGVSFIQRFERLPIPTVVAIRGLCLGGGCEIAQVHDIIFAGESARLGQIEALIGTTTCWVVRHAWLRAWVSRVLRKWSFQPATTTQKLCWSGAWSTIYSLMRRLRLKHAPTP